MIKWWAMSRRDRALEKRLIQMFTDLVESHNDVAAIAQRYGLTPLGPPPRCPFFEGICSKGNDPSWMCPECVRKPKRR